jgi:uroporphyrinogen-III synthase
MPIWARRDVRGVTPSRARLLVTRPRAQAQPWVDRLRLAGVDAQVLPLVDIAALEDKSALQAAWRALGELDFVMFVSANAVSQFFAARPEGAVWPQGLDAGCPGAGTSVALRAALQASGGPTPGLGMTLVAPEAGQAEESESLWALLRERPWDGCRVHIVRGQEGRDWLAERWREAGAHVDLLTAYTRCAPVLDDTERQRLAQAVRQPKAHVFSLASAQAVAHLQELAPGADWSQAVALVSHPRIAAAARNAGFLSVRGVEPGWQGLLKAWVDLESRPL